MGQAHRWTFDLIQWERQRPERLPPTHNDSDFIMTRDLALSLLRSGANGDQILQILETIATPEDATVTDAEPTLNPIEF